jgi:hypothetical protein
MNFTHAGFTSDGDVRVRFECEIGWGSELVWTFRRKVKPLTSAGNRTTNTINSGVCLSTIQTSTSLYGTETEHLLNDLLR